MRQKARNLRRGVIACHCCHARLQRYFDPKRDLKQFIFKKNYCRSRCLQRPKCHCKFNFLLTQTSISAISTFSATCGAACRGALGRLQQAPSQPLTSQNSPSAAPGAASIVFAPPLTDRARRAQSLRSAASAAGVTQVPPSVSPARVGVHPCDSLAPRLPFLTRDNGAVATAAA